MGLTTDDVVRATRKEEDDERWARLQRSKRQTATPPPVGKKTCGDCAAWWSNGAEPYGECSALAAAVFPGTKGRVIVLTKDVAPSSMHWIPLRTAPGFTCPAWKPKE